ncbi:N-acetylmuramoyl-L-alanine amidase [Beijerinckia mobilis]|uniref:N-acetylmuramoyl-L-alanine amidase n=1 Tax=Beijerinckia mobilis TaxID=231434 RepID=UPI0006919F8E|nr:N-acetylmuramoyl-L-alanine amidase [Beijerinckia mobilis]
MHTAYAVPDRTGRDGWRPRHRNLIGAFLSICMMFAGLLAGGGRANALQAPVKSFAVHQEIVGKESRLVFDLSAPVEAKAMVLATPDRIVIDLPAVDFLFDSPQASPSSPSAAHRQHGPAGGKVKPHGLIAAYRFGSFAPGRSRIVIDLTGPAKLVRADIDTRDGKKVVEGADKEAPVRLVIALAPTDRASFRASTQLARQLQEQAELHELATQQISAVGLTDPSRKSGHEADLPVIVIDPGHGGVDSGAIAGDLVEKTLVRDFAKRLEERLSAAHRYRLVMTREEDVFVPLGERVRIARQNQADLFISIHADILTETMEVGGATIYTVSDKASDAEAARLADKENQADIAGGLETKEEQPEVSDILFDLTRRETRAYSHVFARTLLDYWKKVGRLNKNPQRSAGFRVLKAPDVPSVLVELGYLSNENDHAALGSSEWRDKIVTKVAEAVDQFFAMRGPSQTHASAQLVRRGEAPEAGSVPPPLGDTKDLAQHRH